MISAIGREEAIENIHQYLTNIAGNIRAGVIRVDKFVIYKGLTKNPEDYADSKSQPHVQVALAMKARGVGVKVGETIPYIICVGDGSNDGLAKRAFHPEDVKKEGSTLKIGIYL